MKTMLAMALVFGFSALGCGVPVEGDEQTVDEPGVLASALTTSGFCEMSRSTNQLNGYCSAQATGGTCPAHALSPTCVAGTPATVQFGICRQKASLALSFVACTF